MKSETNIFQSSDEALETAVLVLNQSNTLSFAAATDPMRAANRKAGQPLFRWRFVTANGTPAQLTTGLSVDGPAIATLERCDLLIIVAGFDLERQSTAQLGASLRRLTQQGSGIIAIDGGPWVLARAGLLKDHRATTHWEDLDAFATEFPEVDVQRDRYCLSPPFGTSGGASPAIDLMLHLIALRWGAPLAREIAAAFIYEPVPEGQWQSPSALPRDPRRPRVVAQAIDLMAAHLEDPLPIAMLAKRLGQSPRRLQQLFSEHLSETPQARYLALRLSEARRLAQDTNLSVADIAAATGFTSQASFARAFRAAFGLSVRSLRAQL